MDYSIPSKDEIKKALETRFINKHFIHYDAWGCTFYENIIHFVRSPESPYIKGEDVYDIKRNIFMNEIEKTFPDKFLMNSFNKLKVFSECSITQEEMNRLIDKMHLLYTNGIGEFTSWSRVCRIHI